VLDGPPGPLLTVRETARLLRVSTATVYKLCARGELVHVRVLNVIRIPSGAVGTLQARPPWPTP
jgi:excisionase family DNA binding protein